MLPQPPWVSSIRVLRLYFPELEPWVMWSVPSPSPLFLLVYLCANVGPQHLPSTTLWGLLPEAWPSQYHNRTPRLVCQPPPYCNTSPPWLAISKPLTSLDECFFFIPLVFRFPYSSIFCQFCFFFLLLKSLFSFWLCEEAQCVYLCLPLAQKPYVN